MKLGLPRIPFPALGIRRLIVLGSACILLAWAILLGGWLVEKSKLSHIDRRIAQDVKALDETHELELAILRERREDLLWEATGNREHRQTADEDLADAERVASHLDSYVSTPAEQDLSNLIHREMRTLRTLSQSPTLAPSQVAPRLADLLSAVRLFREQNEVQMAQSLQAADRLDNLITDWAIGLAVGTAGLLSVGSLGLIRRIVRPTLAIMDSAAAFGQGNLAARAPVLHSDELGALARTFNNMADDIADREKERLRFVAMVAHDLKNPALAIEMAARLLRGAAGNEKEQSFYLQAMTEESRRLRTIVRDLTDDIQIASGQFSLQKTPVELCALVRRLMEGQAAASPSHQIIVETQEECTVLGDPSRLERVVMNLVSNAVKYSPRHTRITVKVEKKDSFAVLVVADEGRGISKEDLRVIFQPFGRGRSADTYAEGTGIGLYVVKQIVEAHGGRIEVESELGHGATFRVRLPLAPAGRPAVQNVS
jgi:signal transduction histidine kinase